MAGKDSECDPAKSASNKAKRGIDFTVAQRLWGGPALQATTYTGNDDKRTLHVRAIDGVYWTANTTAQFGGSASFLQGNQDAMQRRPTMSPSLPAWLIATMDAAAARREITQASAVKN